MRSQAKTIFLWVMLLAGIFLLWHFLTASNAEVKEIPWSTFMAKVDKHEVKQVNIKEPDIKGKYVDGTEFTSRGPLLMDGKLLDRIEKGIADAAIPDADRAGGVKFEKADGNSLFLQFVLQWMPLLFLVVIFVFFMRQLQAGGGKAMSFGKSKAKLLSEHHNRVTFADVAGIDEAREELEEIIAFLKDPKKFTKLGGRIPKGVLMMGPPGTGKTLLARAIAGEAGVPFFSISGSDFVEMFVGVGASRVRDLFEQGKKNAPCIVFIDEIDAVGRYRGAGLGGGHDEREQTLNQLLVEMDGFESNDGVILIAATNRPDVLDPALLRPGRFDRRIIVPRPDLRGRLGILQVHTRKTPLAPEVDLEVIARGTPGFAGADLENLVNEAALNAARQNQERVGMTDFEKAKDKVLMGVERKSLVMSEKEKRKTAVHEAGHTLVARLLAGEDTDPIHKVSVIPRGPALGITQQLPTEDRLSYSRTYVWNRIAVLMGGRVAEELAFSEFTTGASDDIEKATEMARKMVCEWGMSDKLGPLAFGQKQEEIFLGRDIARRIDYSEQTALEIDSEVKRIVLDQHERVKKLLTENRPTLDRLAAALLEFETLDGADIETLFKGEPLHKPKLTPPAAPARPEKAEKREKKKILDALEGLGKLGSEPAKG